MVWKIVASTVVIDSGRLCTGEESAPLMSVWRLEWYTACVHESMLLSKGGACRPDSVVSVHSCLYM